MPSSPLHVVDIAQSLRPRLGELWQSERIFDRFEVAVVGCHLVLHPYYYHLVFLLCLRMQTPSGDEFATGSYGNTALAVGQEGEHHGWFEAGRQVVQRSQWRGPAHQARLDQRIMSLVRLFAISFQCIVANAFPRAVMASSRTTAGCWSR